MEIFSISAAVFKMVSSLINLSYKIKRYKKQIIDEEEFSDQFGKSIAKVYNHITKLKTDVDIKLIDKAIVANEVKRSITRDNEFLLFYRGEIEERIFDLILPPKKYRMNSFIKYSYFFLNGYHLLSKKYFYAEYILSFWPWNITVLHYISIPGWPNLYESELTLKVIDIKKPSPRIYEKYIIPENRFLDDQNPGIGEAIEKVLNSGTISTETALNLMASEKILLVHKYAEDFGDIYKAQKSCDDELKLNLKQLVIEIEKTKKDKDKLLLQKQKEGIEKELLSLHENWATVPIGTKLEEYGFERLFNNMDGVYGIPLSLIPKNDRVNMERFFNQNIERPASKYLKYLKKHNKFVKNHDGILKYIAIFHTVSIDQLSVIRKERDISISPLLSKTMFRLYLSNSDDKMACLYLNELVRNVDMRFYLNQSNQSDSFIWNNFDKLKMLIYSDYNIDISTPSMIIKLNIDDFEIISKKLISKSKNPPQWWRIRDKLEEIKNKYIELESEFVKLKLKK